MFRFVRSFSSLKKSLVSFPETKITVLPNGLTVATENTGIQTATVGVFIHTGSRFENSRNNGVAHFLEHMAFKGTKSKSQQNLEMMIENMGGQLNAYTSREHTVFYAKTMKSDIPIAVDILSDILQNSTMTEENIERERSVILREQEEVDKQLDEVIFDHLHASAYQGHTLGYTILGPKKNIESIKRQDLVDYVAQNYTADRIVLAAAGGVDHDHLVKLAEKHFSGLPTNGMYAITHAPQTSFTGSDMRVYNEEMPTAHIVMAVEGASWKSPDYYPLLLAQAIVGSWDRSLSSSSHLASALSQRISKEGLAHSYMSFNTNYNDSGLFGMYMVTSNTNRLDDLLYNIQSEWCRLAKDVTDVELARAKQQLKTTLLLQLDGTTPVCEEIGRQLLTLGKRLTPIEIDAAIDAITKKDVMRVADHYIYDKDVSVVSIGNISGMPDYLNIRGAMSWNRI